MRHGRPPTVVMSPDFMAAFGHSVEVEAEPPQLLRNFSVSETGETSHESGQGDGDVDFDVFGSSVSPKYLGQRIAMLETGFGDFSRHVAGNLDGLGYGSSLSH